MKRYLVIVDFSDQPSSPVAGIYVMAETSAQAKIIVREMLAAASLTTYQR